MNYGKLGRTGFEVSGIGHGLWGMSGWSGSSDQESLAALQLAVDLGCNFYDTAWAYGEGKSDGLLGEIMARNPNQRLYAASKIPPANDRWPALPEYKYHDVFSPKHVFKYADKIRQQLRTDTIDLLQFHVWDDSWTNEPDFRSTVEKLKHDGWIRNFGLSINRWQAENGIKALRTGLVDVVQVIYNIFDQSPEDELFPVCQDLLFVGFALGLQIFELRLVGLVGAVVAGGIARRRTVLSAAAAVVDSVGSGRGQREGRGGRGKLVGGFRQCRACGPCLEVSHPPYQGLQLRFQLFLVGRIEARDGDGGIVGQSLDVALGQRAKDGGGGPVGLAVAAVRVEDRRRRSRHGVRGGGRGHFTSRTRRKPKAKEVS